MNQLEYQRELLAFEEKISLSELEASKAKERVDELKYQKARFNLEYATMIVKQQAAAVAAQAQQPPQPVQ